MMTLNATNCRAVTVWPFDWTLCDRPRECAAKLIDRQHSEDHRCVCLAKRVWLEMDGEESDVDADAVKLAAMEMLAPESGEDQ